MSINYWLKVLAVSQKYQTSLKTLHDVIKYMVNSSTAWALATSTDSPPTNLLLLRGNQREENDAIKGEEVGY